MSCLGITEEDRIAVVVVEVEVEAEVLVEEVSSQEEVAEVVTEHGWITNLISRLLVYDKEANQTSLEVRFQLRFHFFGPFFLHGKVTNRI